MQRLIKLGIRLTETINAILFKLARNNLIQININIVSQQRIRSDNAVQRDSGG